MSDVTHFAYAALSEKPGIFEGWVDRAQMEVNLSRLRNLFDPLEAAAKNLWHVSLLQGPRHIVVTLGPSLRFLGSERRATRTGSRIWPLRPPVPLRPRPVHPRSSAFIRGSCPPTPGLDGYSCISYS